MIMKQTNGEAAFPRHNKGACWLFLHTIFTFSERQPETLWKLYFKKPFWYDPTKESNPYLPHW